LKPLNVRLVLFSRPAELVAST